MEDLGVNLLIWWIFMTVTQQAAVHLGNDCLENLHSTKNQPQKAVKQLFMWPESWSKIRKKFKVFPWSIGKKFLGKWRLCWLTVQFGCQQRKPMYSPIQFCARENQWKSRKGMEGENRLVHVFIPMSRIGSNRRGVDGWKIFSGFTTLQILAEIQNMMTEIQCESEQFSGRIIFMSMYNDIVWGEKGNEDLGIANSQIEAEYVRRFAHGHWSFLGLGSERNGPELTRTNWMENEMVSLRTWCSTSVTSRIPWIQCFGTTKFEEVKENCLYTSVATTKPSKCSSHKHFHHQSALTIYEEIANMCDELACRISGCSESTGQFVAQNNSETMVMPTELSTTNRTPRTNDKVQGNLFAAR